MFSFFSGKSLEQHSLCNPGCSFSIVTDLVFFEVTLHVHPISELIRPLLVARTREHSESQLKPKREFISWYNWMSRGQNCIQTDISRHSKNCYLQTISSHLLVLLSSVSSSFSRFYLWLQAPLSLYHHGPENLAEWDFLFSTIPANFRELSYWPCLSQDFSPGQGVVIHQSWDQCPCMEPGGWNEFHICRGPVD